MSTAINTDATSGSLTSTTAEISSATLFTANVIGSASIFPSLSSMNFYWQLSDSISVMKPITSKVVPITTSMPHLY